MAEICVIPISGSTSVRNDVARAYEILAATGLELQLHAYGTNIEGPIDQILAAIQQIHTELHNEGVPRIHTAIKLGTRTDKTQHLEDKIEAVTTIINQTEKT